MHRRLKNLWISFVASGDLSALPAWEGYSLWSPSVSLEVTFHAQSSLCPTTRAIQKSGRSGNVVMRYIDRRQDREGSIIYIFTILKYCKFGTSTIQNWWAEWRSDYPQYVPIQKSIFECVMEAAASDLSRRGIYGHQEISVALSVARVLERVMSVAVPDRSGFWAWWAWLRVRPLRHLSVVVDKLLRLERGKCRRVYMSQGSVRDN